MSNQIDPTGLSALIAWFKNAAGTFETRRLRCTDDGSAHVVIGAGSVKSLPNSLGVTPFTAVGAGQWVAAPESVCAFEAIQTGNGSAVVEIHGSNDPAATPGPGTLIGTLYTLSNGDVATLTKNSAAYAYKLANVTSLTATSVAVTMGV